MIRIMGFLTERIKAPLEGGSQLIRIMDDTDLIWRGSS